MFASVFFGAIVGVIAALTGAGGGILAVPLLVFGLDLTLAQAAPIGLMATGASAALGAILAHRHGRVRYRAATLMALAGMMLTPFGVWSASRVPTRPLTILFALVLAYVGYRTYMKADRVVSGGLIGHATRSIYCKLDETTGRLIWTVPCARVLTGWGMVVGLLSGMLGVGGGFVIVPTLQGYTNLDMRSIVPTSLAVIAMVSIAGVTASTMAGGMNWTIALPFSGGALLGMIGGRVGGAELPGVILQKGFAGLCILVAIALIARTVL